MGLVVVQTRMGADRDMTYLAGAVGAVADELLAALVWPQGGRELGPVPRGRRRGTGTRGQHG